MPMDLVSVIMPVYNGEKCLHTAIESVLSQTYPEFELILVDDGSQDGSLEIIKDYEQRCPKVKGLAQPHQGPAAARNAALVKAQGRFVCFFDSDDFAELAILERLHDKMLENAADLAICGYYTDSYFKDRLVRTTSTLPPKLNAAECRDMARFFLRLSGSGLLNSPCNKMFDLSLIREHQIRFNASLGLTEDTNFVLDCMRFARKAVVIREPLYHVIRRQTASASVSYHENYDYIYRFCCENLWRFLKDRAPKAVARAAMNRAVITRIWTVAAILAGRGCPLSSGEKRRELKKYLDRPQVVKANKRFSPQNWMDKILHTAILLHSPVIVFTAAYALRYFSKLRVRMLYYFGRAGKR